MAGRLAGKVAIVTGGSQGMGEAIARRFVAEGAKVAITDVKDAEGEALATELGGNACYLHHDVSKADEWSTVVAETAKRFGPISILVNNAGIIIAGNVQTQTEEQLRVQLDVNLTGVFLGMKAVLPSMREAGRGSIINQSSSAGIFGGPGAIGYTATKWAVRGMTKAAAVELGPLGIRVNSIHPHVVVTPMALANGATTKMNVPPVGRFGEVDDAAWLAVFLASDESGYISGEEHVLDGGSLAGLPGAKS